MEKDNLLYFNKRNLTDVIDDIEHAIGVLDKEVDAQQKRKQWADEMLSPECVLLKGLPNDVKEQFTERLLAVHDKSSYLSIKILELTDVLSEVVDELIAIRKEVRR